MKKNAIFLTLITILLTVTNFSSNYAIIVGINDYRYLMPLSYAEKDATDMEKVLKDYGYEVTLLTNQSATKEAIQSEIRYISEIADLEGGSGKLLFFYFSGHGIGGTQTGIFTTYMRGGDTPYTQEELIGDLGGFPGEKILFLDACYQGKEKDFTRKPVIDSQTAVMQKRIDLFIAASASNEGARDGFLFEGQKINNGVATYLFLRGIQTKEADLNYDGSYTVGEIGEYFTRMKEIIKGEISQRPEAHYEAAYYRALVLSGGRPTPILLPQPPASVPIGTCLLKIRAGNALALTGTVTVDGKEAGVWKDGWIILYDLEKGKHTIALEGEQINSESVAIEFIRDYDSKEIAFEGKTPTRIVRVVTQPIGAVVELNGERKGGGPVQEEVEIGKEYAIKVSINGYETKEEKLWIPRKGEVIVLNIELQKINPEKYQILTKPEGADIYVDGVRSGTTTVIVELMAGTHTITGKKVGYYDETKTVEVTGVLEKDLVRVTTRTVELELKAIAGSSKDMVKVTRGTFQMGNVRNDSEGQSDEKPVRAVTFTYDYWIGKYEVTFS